MNLILAIAATTHLGLAGDYNEVHPHVQLQFDNGAVVGAYYNSEESLSVYGGLRLEADNFFTEIGAVTGYSGMPVAPFIRVGYEIGENIEVFATPALETANGGNKVGLVLGISLKF